MAFTHLHVHSEFSLLDGLASVKELANAAKQQCMSSLAITDHGNMFGVVDFYNATIKAGVKPIIGCEIYTTPRSRLDKDHSTDRESNHLVLLAKDQTGYFNLVKIVSDANTEGFYYRPRSDIDFIRGHADGLIALSACLAGDVPGMLLKGDYQGAKALALTYLDIFGDGNYYLEIQDQGLEEEQRIREPLIRLSKETGIPLVATNDIHYISREDAEAHDVLLCAQTKQTIKDSNRMRFTGDQFYFRSEDEMRLLFSDIPEAIENTNRIAEMCNFEFDFGTRHLPKFDAPQGKTSGQYLREVCESGFEYRYGDKKEDHREQFEHELSVIERAGFTDYFLIVWDFLRYAREQNIPVGPGRGSAAGSIIAYCLRITNIDPIAYGLIFERFLTLERVTMPDIDIDFCIERRGEVIDYVREKYGQENVAQIITFGRLKTKAAFKAVGRALDIPYGEVDKLVNLIPAKAGNIKEALEGVSYDKNGDIKEEFKVESKVFRQALEAKDSDGIKIYKNLLKFSEALEGKASHPGMHAAGVVICDDKLADCIPLCLTKDKAPCVQYNMTTVEELGFLKMDFLGLRNLTVIAEAERIIERHRGEKVDLSLLDFEDAHVFDLISSGNTEGVFQLENGGMQNFMRQLSPNCFEDIIVGVSMYRPGPMDYIPVYLKNRSKPKDVSFLHPKLKPILDVTYGVMVYQEQVMQIARDLAGYSFSRSDEVRRAMSKKKEDVMMRERQYFVHGMKNDHGEYVIQGCINNGIPESVANEIYDRMVKFSAYAFNKSHAAVYAVLAYQTAYLKTYYTAEFMAALMSSVMNEIESVAKYIRSAKDMGIQVLPPDVLNGEKRFHVKNGAIIMGLQSVKNVGESAIDAIIAARETHIITDLQSFVSAIDTKRVNRRAVESLIYAGAFDSLCPNRAKAIEEYSSLVDHANNPRQRDIPGQISLFFDEPAEVVDYPIEFKLEKEKEMLGLYFSAHPLDKYQWIIDEICTTTVHRVKHPDEYEDEHRAADSNVTKRSSVVIVGLINSVRKIITKKGEAMATLFIEDHYGVIEVVVFPKTYKEYFTTLIPGNIVVLRGKEVHEEDKPANIHAIKITPIHVVEEFYARQNGSIAKKNGGSDNE
jgi:DNA polymerase-3 subunit alpha